jgi:hypothetical protein
MKISAISAPGQGLTTVITEHGGERLTWDVSPTYGRSNSRGGKGSIADDEIDSAKLFDEFNGYVATLSMERQQGIWEAFQDIYAIFRADYELETATEKLKQKIRSLYSMIPMAELRHWLQFYGNINYPATVKERLDGDEITDRSPSRTYLRADYFGLVVFTVALRPMLPIWGEYIAATRRDSGNNYKENRAWGLLYHTELPRSPEYDRLLEFITHTSQNFIKQDETFTAILEGLSTAEMPSWMLAITAVRRLVISEIHPDPDQRNKNLIAMVHFFIDSKILSMPRDFGRKFGGRISDKKPPAGQSEESNSSVVEQYKIKPDIPDGHIVSLNVYSEDPHRMLLVRDPDVPTELLEKCLNSIKDMAPRDIDASGMWLTRWAISPVLPARAIDLLLIDSLKNTMAVSQATLWHWGFYDLAALVTATPQITNDEIITAPGESRGKVNKEMMSQLAQNYTYHPQVKRSTSVRQARGDVRAIDALADLISRNDWILNAPSELIEASSTIGDSRFMMPPPLLRVQLGHLLLHPKFNRID